LARLAHEKGGMLSINHDKPAIAWEYELPEADCQEVWQSTWMAWNWIALERWQGRLAAGLRLSAIGGSDYHQPAELRPEGPLVLARPTTMLWLPELSEDAILAAMKAGHGYITESPTGPSLVMSVDGQPMGSEVPAPRTLSLAIEGAGGDRLSLIDATGEIASLPITSDQWQHDMPMPAAKGFIRAEIIAEASRERLGAEFLDLIEGRELPWQLRGVDLAEQPIRRALGNPIYIGS
jgi:hypothetical protein